MKVIVRPQFYTDVSEEVEWLLENAGAEVAKRWHDALWQTVQFLKTHPRIGRERQDLKRSGVRSWRVNHFTRWLIFLRGSRRHPDRVPGAFPDDESGRIGA